MPQRPRIGDDGSIALPRLLGNQKDKDNDVTLYLCFT